MADEIELPGGEKPPLAINPSKWQSIAISIVLACITAYGVASNLLIYASTRDVAGLLVYLRGNDFLQGISAVARIGGFAGIVWRSARRKARELFLESNVAPSVAYLKGSEFDPSAAPPTRARETTTAQPATRLVDSMVLHRAVASLGQAVAEPDVIKPRAKMLEEMSPDERRALDQSYIDAPNAKGSPAFQAMYASWAHRADQNIDQDFRDYLIEHGWTWNGVSWKQGPEAALDQAIEDVVGKATLQVETLDKVVAAKKRNTPEFDALYDEWMTEGFIGTFAEFLATKGWAYTDGQWKPQPANEVQP